MAIHIYNLLLDYVRIKHDHVNARQKLNQLEHAINYSQPGNSLQFDHYDKLHPLLEQEQDTKALKYIQRYLIPFYCKMWVKLGCPDNYKSWTWEISQWTNDNYLGMILEIRNWLDLNTNY